MQGFNMGRYVPPELEGTTSGNKLNKKHPLGSRASKPGALTVRFEMPFATWCTTCPKPTIIGQGVRFNASKSRVGSYHSTPIFAFRMKHNVCGGAIEIRTDPANTAYVVTEGGRKRDDADGQLREGDWEIMTDAEREKLRGNAFAKLEKTIEDREQMIVARQRVEELQEGNGKTWEDPYEMNRRLRRDFRVGRHQREKEGETTEELRNRMGLGMELVPETEEDVIRAGLVDFGSVLGMAGEENWEAKGLSRPLSKKADPRTKKADPKGGKKLKSEVKAQQMKENLVSTIVGHARATQDPFLNLATTPAAEKTLARIPRLKRKRAEPDAHAAREVFPEKCEASATVQEGLREGGRPEIASTTLVSYDSGSE